MKQTKIGIKIDRKPKDSSTPNVTNFVQVKNSSREDQMSEVDFVYLASSGNKDRLHVADSLQPQKMVKIDFANAGLSVQVVNFLIAWQFQGIGYGSQLHTAKSGSYFYSIDVGLSPDGSSETDWFVEKPLV